MTDNASKAGIDLSQQISEVSGEINSMMSNLADMMSIVACSETAGKATQEAAA